MNLPAPLSYYPYLSRKRYNDSQDEYPLQSLNQVPLDWYIDQLECDAKQYGYPIDGIVAKFNSIAYGKTLGETSHHFKNAIAYKFYDETYPTELIDIEWTMGRTGVLTPVAVFKPIEIDGSTVERASLHNWTVLNETLHGHGWKGQKVWISKRKLHTFTDIQIRIQTPKMWTSYSS